MFGGEARVLTRLLASGVNAPVTQRGRLFDAVASLLGVRHRATFEGQAAMELEYAAEGIVTEARYPFRLDDRGSVLVADWEPMIRTILDEAARGAAVGQLSAAFHNTLAEMMVAVARRVGRERVVSPAAASRTRASPSARSRGSPPRISSILASAGSAERQSLALGKIVAAVAG
jgi:hydrogenase maturation protein HypF